MNGIKNRRQQPHHKISIKNGYSFQLRAGESNPTRISCPQGVYPRDAQKLSYVDFYATRNPDVTREVGPILTRTWVFEPLSGSFMPDATWPRGTGRPLRSCRSSLRPDLWHDAVRHDDPDRRPVSFRHQ